MRGNELINTEAWGAIFIDKFLMAIHATPYSKLIFPCNIRLSSNEFNNPSINQLLGPNINTVNKDRLWFDAEGPDIHCDGINRSWG